MSEKLIINGEEKVPWEVTIHYDDGEEKVYEGIYFPSAFVKAIMKTDNEWISISLNGEHWGDNPNHPKNQII